MNFNKRKFNDKPKSIKRTKQKEVEPINEVPIVEQVPQTQRTKPKTLERLTKNEELSTSLETQVQTNTTTISTNYKDINDRVKLLEEFKEASKLNQAAFVLDTTDSNYKNVKDIIINNSINSNLILYKGKYDTIENVLKGVNKQVVAHQVMFNEEPREADTLLKDYLPIKLLKDIVGRTKNSTFEEFIKELERYL